MRREFRIINTSDEFGEKTLTHDYDMVVQKTEDNETLYTLYRSNSSEWSADSRGEVCIKVIDDGNGFIFPKKLRAKSMDYLEGAELLIVLNFINKIDNPLYEGYYEEVVPSNKITI